MDFNNIHNLINRPSLAHAIAALQEECRHPGLTMFADELRSVSEAYNNMVRFMLNGTADPQRDRFIASLQQRLHTVASLIERAERTNSGDPGIYYSTLRTLATTSPDDGLTAEVMLTSPGSKEHEQAVMTMFNRIWVAVDPSQSAVRQMVDAAVDADTPFDVASQIVNAIMLGAVEYYESWRLTALLDIYDRTPLLSLKARALTAAVLIMTSARMRLAADALLKERLEAWIADDENYERLKIVVLNVMRAADTDRINDTIRTDVLPKFQKIQPEIMNSIKDAGKAGPDADYNPEWEEILRKSGLEDRLRELTEMQMEGADVLMLPMANLKNYPFFHEPANWFLPFSAEHTEVADALNEFSEFAMILEAPGTMCDSDKYSMALSLTRLPESQRSMLSQQLQAGEEMLREGIEENALAAAEGKRIVRDESTRMLRNVYRFCRLFRRKDDFRRLFDSRFRIDMIPFWRHRLLDDAKMTGVLSDFYLKCNNFEYALRMLTAMLKAGISEAPVYEKMGYCYQRLQRDREALEAYDKAYLLNPDSKWLVKRMAAVCRRLDMDERAVGFYEKALETDPDNVSMLMHYGDSLLALDRYDDALKTYSKIYWLQPDSRQAVRALAWVEFMLGHYDKSIGWYAKVLADKPDSADYINAGYVYLAAGRYSDARDMFSHEPHTELAEAVKADHDVLVKAGVDPVVLAVILDLIA